jgi:hypothetical protein
MNARVGPAALETVSNAKYVQTTSEKSSDSVVRGNVFRLVKRVGTSSKCIINEVWRVVPLH